MASFTVLLLALVALVPYCRSQSLGLSAEIQAKKIATAIELNDKAQVDATAVIQNEVTIARSLSNAVTEIGIYVGTSMVQDLFNQGVQRVKLANEQLKKTDFSSAVNFDVSISNYGMVAVNAFKECVAGDPVLKNLDTFFMTQGSKLIKVNTDAFNFRLNVAACSSRAVEIANETDNCIAATKAKYPYPVVQQYQVDTLTGINNIYACINYAADKLNVSGGVTINQLKKYLPFAVLNIVPTKFDLRPVIEPITAGINSYIPQAKVKEIQNSLNRTKNIVRLAGRDKQLNFLQAKGYLKDLVKPYFNVLNKISVPISAQYCKNNANIAGVINLNLKSSGLITCIAQIESPPSNIAYILLENSFTERELKEKLFIPSVDCAKDLHTAFNKSRLQSCIKIAENSYSAFLNTTQLTSAAFFTNAVYVRKLVRRCECNAELELQKQLRNDLWELESCLMSATKKRPNLSKTGFCSASSNCRFANFSVEYDEGELPPYEDTDNTTSTDKPSTVDNRNEFSTEPTGPSTPTTPTTKPTIRVTPKPDPNSCTVFNSTFAADGCGQPLVFTTDVINPAKYWDAEIKF